MHLGVDVDRAPHIPARVDRLELHDPLGVRDLCAAKVCVPVGGPAALCAGCAAPRRPRGSLEARVDAERVAMPDVDDRVLDWLAGALSTNSQREPQRSAGTTFTDVAADRVDVDVVGA